jgi:hypothetical protein
MLSGLVRCLCHNGHQIGQSVNIRHNGHHIKHNSHQIKHRLNRFRTLPVVMGFSLSSFITGPSASSTRESPISTKSVLIEFHGPVNVLSNRIHCWGEPPTSRAFINPCPIIVKDTYNQDIRVKHAKKRRVLVSSGPNRLKKCVVGSASMAVCCCFTPVLCTDFPFETGPFGRRSRT